MDASEASSSISARGKGKIIDLASGNSDFSRDEFNKWKSEYCDEFASRGILTTNDYNSWHDSSCSDLTRDQHRDSMRFHAQRTTNIEARLNKWESCIKANSDLTRISCWYSPRPHDEDLVTLNVFWWSVPNIDVELANGISVIGGELVSGEVRSISPRTTIFPIRRNTTESLSVIINAKHSSGNYSCAPYLPASAPDHSQSKDLPFQRQCSPSELRDLNECQYSVERWCGEDEDTDGACYWEEVEGCPLQNVCNNMEDLRLR